MPSLWKTHRPTSRAAFEARFPDEAACGRHLAERRWPDGFVCPLTQDVGQPDSKG